MNGTSEKAMMLYAEAYQKLYKRMPKDLHALDNNWVVVNGARMRVAELEYLTKQLQLEYSQSIAERRNLVNRVLRWFKQ